MARLSPFHLARLFREETGLPPAAFLMAVRMEEARRKLLQTNDSVADISLQVGYTSLGAFTTRFTKVIGISPGRYRRLAALGSEAVDFVAGKDDAPSAYGSILGRIRRSDGMDQEPVYIAAFPAGQHDDPSSCHRLARCRRIEHCNGTWRMPHVPEGRWFVQAVSRTDSEAKEPIVVGTAGPLRIEAGTTASVDVLLEPIARARPVDDARFLLGSALPELFAR
jgi:hypothetical protein